MSPKTTIPLVLAAVVALGGVSGLAYAKEKSEGHESAKELAALQSAKISLTEAIATAQKEVADGKVIDAGVENENGTMSYAVEIEKNGTVTRGFNFSESGMKKAAFQRPGNHTPTANSRGRNHQPSSGG